MTLIARDSALDESAGPATDGLEAHPLYLPRLWATLHPQGTLRDLIFEHDGVAAAAALGVFHHRRRILGRETTLTIPFAPWVRDDDPARAGAFLSALLDHCRDVSCRSVELHWCYGACDALEACRPIAAEIEPEVEFLIDLTVPEATLLGSYAPGARRHNRAQRDGLSTEIGGTWEDLLHLRSLQLSSSSRAAEKNNPYSLPEEEYYRQVFQACLEPGYSRILFALKEGRRISGLMFLVHAGRALVQRGGSSPEAYPIGASRYLHFMLLKHLKESGCRDVYFGGVPDAAREDRHPEHGLYEFKRAFPATEHRAFRARLDPR